MTDLAELFDSTTPRLREVRDGGAVAGAPTAIDTSSLETVFSSDAPPLREQPGPAIAAGLAEMIAGLPAERTGIGTEQVDDVNALRALVGPSAPVSTAMPTGSQTPGRAHKSRPRRDGVVIVAAVIAVVAVLAAVVVVTTTLLTRPVTSDALRALGSSEALLIDRTEALNTRSAALDSRRDALVSRAEELERSLAAMAQYGDESARLAAESARREHVRAIEAIEVPAPAPHYRRDVIDTTSLDDVARAMNATQARMLELDRAEEQLVRAEEALAAADGGLRDALVAFTATVPATAAVIVAENPDAEESFRTAVAQAAADVADSDPGTTAGLGTWAAYIAAVQTLRADQQRALDAIAALREADSDSVYQGFYPEPGQPPAATDEPAPTSPGGPEPEPGPIDPEPTEPVDPDPDEPPAEETEALRRNAPEQP